MNSGPVALGPPALQWIPLSARTRGPTGSSLGSADRGREAVAWLAHQLA